MSEEKTNQKPKQKDQLLDNAMGLSPQAVVYSFPNTLIEETVTRWLEARGINTDNIMVRVILKDEWRNAVSLAKAANLTKLPFLVVLFKQMVEDDDFEVKGGLGSDIMKNLRAGLNNFRDFTQLHLRDNTPLNKLLTEFNGRKVDWELQKKSRRAYMVLDSDSVMCLCFKIQKNEIGNFTFDYLEKPHTKLNPETRRKEFWSKIAISRTRSKRRPTQDPLNDIR